MKVLHVVAGLDSRFGGPSYCIPRLCAAQRDVGCKASIATIQGEDDIGDPSVRAFPHDWAGMPKLGQLRYSSALHHALSTEVQAFDIIHSHGLWSMPNVAAGNASALAGRPLVVSPHGMLASAALQQSDWQKWLFWRLLQKRSYSGAAAWLAASDTEAADIRAFGIAAEIAVIPHGIDIPASVAGHSSKKARRTLVVMARLHPHKNIEQLIRLWPSLARMHADWDLVVAGDGEAAYLAKLQAIVRSLNLASIRFMGYVCGVAKEALLRDADLLVLPSKSENFGMVVGEALAAGVPTVVTKGAPWSELELRRCGWWVDGSAAALGSALGHAMALTSSERKAMGARGREWMKRDYSWGEVARRTSELYRSVMRV